MRGEHPPAEAVDGGDPGPLNSLEDDAQLLELLALRRPLARCKLVSDPAPQLIRGTLGEGEGEDAARAGLPGEGRGPTSGSRAAAQKRSTRTVVLPVPAPARRNTSRSRLSTAALC